MASASARGRGSGSLSALLPQPVLRRNAVRCNAGAPRRDAARLASDAGRMSHKRSTMQPQTWLRSSTREANRPAPLWRARAHPPPIDGGIRISQLGRISSEGPAPQDPMRCGDVRRCNVRPTHAGIERRCASDIGMIQSRHSRRIVPIRRSQVAFAFGLETGDRKTSRPGARIESSRCLAKIASRSWISYLWLSVSPMTSLSCCSVQFALGCKVTFICARRRVPCSMTTKT